MSGLMSVRIVRDAVLPADMKQRARAKLLLLLLALRADEDGRNAWPAVSTLASNGCMAARTVDKVLRQLQAGLQTFRRQRAGRNVRDHPVA